MSKKIKDNATPEQLVERQAAVRRIHDFIISEIRNLHVRAGLDVIVTLNRYAGQSLLSTRVESR